MYPAMGLSLLCRTHARRARSHIHVHVCAREEPLYRGIFQGNSQVYPLLQLELRTMNNFYMYYNTNRMTNEPV